MMLGTQQSIQEIVEDDGLLILPPPPVITTSSNINNPDTRKDDKLMLLETLNEHQARALLTSLTCVINESMLPVEFDGNVLNVFEDLEDFAGNGIQINKVNFN
jgi:hypothetical protein